MTKQIDPNKSYFYYCWGDDPRKLNGCTVKNLRAVGNDGFSAYIKGEGADPTYVFEIEGREGEFRSHYPWAFWENTPEGREGFARRNKLIDQADALRRQATEIVEEFTLSGK